MALNTGPSKGFMDKFAKSAPAVKGKFNGGKQSGKKSKFAAAMMKSKK